MGQDTCCHGLQEWIHAGRVSANFHCTNGSISDGKMLSGGSNRAHHGPLRTVDHDLGAHQPVGKRRDDLLALFGWGESIFAETVAEQATEQGLAAPMPGRSLLGVTGAVGRVGCPDDVVAGAQDHFAQDHAGLAPDYETADPQSGLGAPGLRLDFQIRAVQEFKLPRH